MWPEMRAYTPESEALAFSDEEGERSIGTANPDTAPNHGFSGQPSSFKEPYVPIQMLPKQAHHSHSNVMVSSESLEEPRGPSWYHPRDIDWSPKALSSSTWGANIWNSDPHQNQNSLPPEVVTSPTSLHFLSKGEVSHEKGAISPTFSHMTSKGHSSRSLSGPSQPAQKQYRSQSYSAGQMDPVARYRIRTLADQLLVASPKSGTSYSSLKNRHSRPSMLGEVTYENPSLEQLCEDDDDVDRVCYKNTVRHRSLVSVSERNKYNEKEQTVWKDDTRDESPLPWHNKPPYSQEHWQIPTQESEFKAQPSNNEGCERQTYFNVGGGPNITADGPNRRFSEFAQSPTRYASLSRPENQQRINVIHSRQGNLREDSYPIDLARSRRHSFAEMPTHRNSPDSDNDGSRTSRQRLSPYNYAASILQRPRRETSQERVHLPPPHSQRNLPNDQVSAVTYSDHKRPCQLLFIVTFKCLRADVFYMPASSNIKVTKGDLVIVEADRGLDLGTIATEPLNWIQGRQLKEIYTRKHHEWLMAFSQYTQNGSVAGSNPNGPSLQHSPCSGTRSVVSETPCGDIKPKSIKRLAIAQEIAALREKEGAEAKAKRMCQQKVLDHRLRMEILDAEYQVDWKKLTFFYFADSYVNFNALVTDLFKIYKTRIWMFAINTAAIASIQPTAGLKLPDRHAPSFNYEMGPKQRFEIDHTPLTASAPLYASAILSQDHRHSPRRSAVSYTNSLPHLPGSLKHSHIYNADNNENFDYTRQISQQIGVTNNNQILHNDWISAMQTLALGRNLSS